MLLCMAKAGVSLLKNIASFVKAQNFVKKGL